MLRIAVLLGVLALALGGCGGDDSGNGNPAGDTTAAQTDTNAATPTSKKSKEKTTTRGEPQIQLENGEPAPPLSERKRKQRQDLQDLPSGAPTPKQDLAPKDQQIYDISLFFCKETGIEGMRREYHIKSTNPEDIAREAARRTYGRGGAEAVYSGCLEGLRQSK